MNDTCRQIDYDWVSENLPPDKEFLVDIFGLFERQMLALKRDTLSALQQGVYVGYAENVHKMRGSAASMGLRLLAARLGELDQTLKKNGKTAQVQEQLVQLPEAIDTALREMRTYIDNYNSH